MTDFFQYLVERQLTIDWLVENNFPPLPVAPVQDAREYPKVVSPSPKSGIGLHCPLTSDLQPVPLYTGKNPSYLDADGKPHLVLHSDYQRRLPTSSELESWFTNELTGIGTLGGWNDAVWLDFDRKRFGEADCDDCVLAVVAAIRDSSGCEPFLERTHSGGWRVGVRVTVKPAFTNFALFPGGRHVGEALGAGRFTVLAPTVGPSGNLYESVNRPPLPVVESLESIGIFSSSRCHAIPTARSSSSPVDSHDGDSPGSIDLADLLCPSSRSILDGSDPKSDRSGSLVVLINELLGWHNWAAANGLTVCGNPTDLTYRAGERLGIDEARVGRIITSVGDLSSKQPAAFYQGGAASCWKKIYRLDRNSFHRLCPPFVREAILSDFKLSSSIADKQQLEECQHPRGDRFEPQPEPSRTSQSKTLVDRIEAIIASEYNESKAVEALMELAASSGKRYSDVALLARLVRSELEFSSEIEAAISSLRPLLLHCRKRLDIRRYLVRPLADAILDAAAAMPTAPEYLLNTLIPVAASRIGTSSRVVVNPKGGYVQPCIFWSANVANSGQAKTPPQSLIIDPLEDLDRDSRDRYSRELADWQAATDKNKGPKPIETRRILNDCTIAQKIRLHSENPTGILEYIDELPGDFERLNQYNGGKGADLRHELGFFNGKFGAYDRGDVRLYLHRVAFSKTGTYQWDTLARLMVDQVDFIASGYLARFLLCSIVDAPERKLDLFSDRDAAPLSDLLRNLYRRLETLPERDYLLSREAKILFQAFNHSLVDAEIQESHFALSLVYAKIETYAARLALWLHVVNAVAVGENPAPTISGETMQSAIELAAFYLWQHKLIYAHNAPSSKLEGVLLKTHTCAQKLWTKGKALTASFAKSRINAIKSWTTAKIRENLFRVLAAAGFGRTEGTGDKLVYIPDEPSSPDPSPPFRTFSIGDVDEFGVRLADASISQPLATQEQQPTVDAVGAVLTSLDEDYPDPDPILQSANSTNNEPESLVSPQLEDVGETSTLPPTVGELQTLLENGSDPVQLLRWRTREPDLFKQAYRSLCPQTQARFDGLLAARYSEPIYKYFGSQPFQVDGYFLVSGDLVRLKDSTMRSGIVSVVPLHAPAFVGDLRPPQFACVNPAQLSLVAKIHPPSSSHQLDLL